MNWNEIFKYNAGWLYWKIRPANKIHIGDLAGSLTINKNGYLRWRIRYNNKNYTVSRIIWEMHNGAIPEGMEVDHIDGDSLNNKIENLRLATQAQQAYNQKLPKTNASGIKGVHKFNGQYRAQIRINGKTSHIGCYNTLKEAEDAYNTIAIKLHGEFVRLK